MTDYVYYQSLTGIFGTIVGAVIGVFSSRYFLNLDKKRAYIINAQNVLLTLSRQISELETIRRYFKKYELDECRHLVVKRYVISATDWRLSRADITKLNSGKGNIMTLIFELIRINQNFNVLLDCIQDYNECREPLEDRIKDGNEKMNELELNELKQYLDTIYVKLDKSELLKITNSLYSYFKLHFPYETFPKPEVISEFKIQGQQI